MPKLTDSFYAILKPTKRYGIPVNGQRPVQEFAVSKIRRGKPYTNADEVAVKINVTIDSNLFDEVIPVVDIELTANDVFVNAEVSAEVEPEDAE